jgi:N-acetylmuramoyl-L-alanine amidase-like protein
VADTGIATRLRAAGLDVREVKDWKTRGRDFAGVSGPFRPKGCVNHHTAGPPETATSKTPSLRVVTFGRSDLPGPLCNVYLGYDNVVYVVAAGVANHAGLPDGGVCRGMHGNSEAYGLEIEHTGTSALPMDRVRLAARIHAALIWKQNIKPSQVVQHWEWAPSRKIDVATNLHPGTNPTSNGFRSLVAQELERLTPVEQWQVSFLNQQKQRVEETVKNPGRWARTHPGAFQRGRVSIAPRRS